MRKLSLAVIGLAMALPALAFASNFGIGAEYEYFHGTSSTSSANTIAVVPTMKFNKNVTLDAKVATGRTTGANDLFTTIEGRAAYDMPLGEKFSLGVRGGYGVAYTNGNDTGFYSVEPRVAYQFDPKWGGNLSYRYVDGVSGDYGTNQWKLGADYTLENKDVVGAKVTYTDNGFDGVGFQLSYNVGF
jgi:hypothetical protein